MKFLSLILLAQDDDFLDVVMGIMPPVRTWNEETTSNMQYVTDVLFPKVNVYMHFKRMSPLQSLQAHVRFIMEVKNIARHIAEIVLFNWVEQIHQLLLQY